MNNLLKELCQRHRNLLHLRNQLKKEKTNKIDYNTKNDYKILKWMKWFRKSEIIDKAGMKLKVTKNVKEVIEGTVEIERILESTLKQLKSMTTTSKCSTELPGCYRRFKK